MQRRRPPSLGPAPEGQRRLILAAGARRVGAPYPEWTRNWPKEAKQGAADRAVLKRICTPQDIAHSRNEQTKKLFEFHHMSRGWRFKTLGPLSTCGRASPDWRGLLRFQRSHIDGEAILHVGLEQPLVGFIDLLDGNDFDIGSDVVCAAKVEHLLGLGDTADRRSG